MSQNFQTIIDSLLELWNTGNPEVVKQLYASGAERRDPNLTEATRGPEEIARYVAEVRVGYPDFTLHINDVVAQDNRLAVHWTVTGTHRGEWQGIAPTGKRINISGLSLEVIDNGKIIRDSVYFDRLTLLDQLGVSPETVQRKASAAAR